jgi:hypothetical protein
MFHSGNLFHAKASNGGSTMSLLKTVKADFCWSLSARFSAVFLCLCTLLAFPARPQSTYGTLLGTVTDSSGGVVAGATVTVTETRTGTSKDRVTDSRGDYQIPNLLSGTYDVAVSANGFKKSVKRGVPLDPRSEVRIDMQLELGTTSTIVEVKAALPVITTETGTVSDVQLSREISQLPLNYRAQSTSPLNAITNLPGVQVDLGGATGNASISVAGNHPAQNEVSVDGFSVTSPRFNGPTVEMFPSTEAISEVKITSEAAPAEFGQVGDITFTGKGGTNSYHGSLYEYFQNDKLDAGPGFGELKPPKRDNTFGGSIGGPVRLPHFHGKDHTFFFFDWESNRQRSSANLDNNVPTPAMLAGDFSSLCATYDVAGNCTSATGSQLVNPLTGQNFANNKIPSGQFNPTSLTILQTFYPNATDVRADPLDTADNYIKTLSSPLTANLFDVRIDQNITSKQSIFGRFSWKHYDSESPQDLGPKTGLSSFILNPKVLGLSYTYTIHPNLLNEFRFGYNTQTTLQAYPGFPDGAALISQLGLQQLGPFPAGSAFPFFEFDGSSGLTSVPGTRQEARHEHKYQIADNVTWIRGRHTLKFGLDVRAIRSSDFESFIGPDNFGNFFFDGQFTGNDFADFLLGLPSFTAIVNAGPDFNGFAKAHSFFGQDSFQISPKLTVSFGLRYEVHPPFHDNTLQITNFDPTNGSVVVPNAKSLALATQPFLQSINSCSLAVPNPPSFDPNVPCTPVVTAAQNHIPDTLRFTDYGKILPRLSVAYRLSNKTVLRAGAGLYDETVLGSIFYSLTGIHTSNYQQFNNAITSGVPAIQFPNTKSGDVSNGSGPAGNAVFGTANSIHLHDPYAEQWTLTAERDLGWETGLRVTYSALRSIGLIVSPDLNQVPAHSSAYNQDLAPFPNWSVIKSRVNGASSFYNGLETVVTHRFSKGLFLQSSWVWSKNLSDAEGDESNGGFVAENGPRITDRFNIHADSGNVSYSRRHRWLTTARWDIPVGRGQRWGSAMNPILNAVAGNWQTSNIFVVQTGPYLTPFYSGGLDPSGTNSPQRPGQQRPDRLPASACAGLGPSQGQVFGGSCFTYDWPISFDVDGNPLNAIGRFGNSGVGILEGHGSFIWNFGLAKVFRLTERLALRFESTFTNFTNHLNPGQPDMEANSSNFGSSGHSRQGPEGAAARTAQFALRLDF